MSAALLFSLERALLLFKVLRNLSVSRRLGLIVIVCILGVAMYGHATARPAVTNTSLRDSCGASELLIGVRGSGETGDQTGGLGDIVSSVNHRFSAHMMPTQVVASPIDYMAVSVDNYATAWMYDQSYAHGREQLVNTLYYWNHTCSNYRFVLAGYSQGADVLADVIAGLNPANATDATILNKIDGVALFGDPRYNPKDIGSDATPELRKAGLLSAMPSNHAGARPLFPTRLFGKVRSWCRQGDPVCQVPLACSLNAWLPSLKASSACVVSIGAMVSEHNKYIAGGQTEAAGAWLAEHVRITKVKVPLSFLPPAIPLPKPIASQPTPTANMSPKPSVVTNPLPNHAFVSSSATVLMTSGIPPSEVNRQISSSYDRMQPGAPYHGYFNSSWQSFSAASNTLTYLATTIGTPGAAAGSTVATTLTLRLCSDVICNNILSEAHPSIVNYGETGMDIGTVAVTPGATYYIVWYQSPALAGQTWVAYWWGGGSTIASSDQMQAAVRGYNR